MPVACMTASASVLNVTTVTRPASTAPMRLSTLYFTDASSWRASLACSPIMCWGASVYPSPMTRCQAWSLVLVTALASAATPAEQIPPRPTTLSPTPLRAPDQAAYRRGFIRDLAIVYRNGTEHAENVELHLLSSGRMLLAFRGGGTGQPETPDARIRVFEFDPLSYRGTLLTDVAAAPATPPRGIRDPKLVSWEGKLVLSAISRQAGFPVRDLLSNARTVIAQSADAGATFSTPLPAVFEGTADPTFGIWRYAWRQHRE